MDLWNRRPTPFRRKESEFAALWLNCANDRKLARGETRVHFRTQLRRRGRAARRLLRHRGAIPPP